MRFTDRVWQVDNAGAASQTILGTLIQKDNGLPFFSTELLAVQDAEQRFIGYKNESLLALERDSALIDLQESLQMLAPQVAALADGTSGGDISGGFSAIASAVTITKTGNAVAAIVCWDGASGGTCDSVSCYDGITDTSQALTKLSETTVGGSSGHKMSTWLLPNKAAGSYIVSPTFGGTETRGLVAGLEVKDCAAAPLDITLVASGSDAVPTTASAENGVVNEVIMAALLVAGAPIPGQASTPSYAGTGNGTISGATGGYAPGVAQTITITATDATHFSVVGSLTGPMSAATVGTPYANSTCSFLLTAGGTAFIVGDRFSFTTTLPSANFPVDPEGFAQQPQAFNQYPGSPDGTWFTLFVWTQSISAFGSYGFGTTLYAAADWAVIAHSFTGGPLS